MRRLHTSSMKAIRRSPRDRRGAAMVEFAMIAPVFLAIILGVVEIGQAINMTHLLSSGLREGGRLATMDWKSVVAPGTSINDKVEADIRNFYIAAGLPGDEITIAITSAEGDDAGDVFDLSDPDNNGRMFKLSAELPYSAGTNYPAAMMKNKSVSGALIFRAGRTTLTQ